MIYGSVCSGVEAASLAWEPLGWRAAFLSEIEAFPRAVLSHHWPEVPLHGDFTTIRAGDYPAIDLLAGGTPCQSFSVAGLRNGLDDERGNLALEYCRLARRLRPRWVVWENVPGVLSIDGGRAFGSIVGALVELGYRCAWRVLDAQYYGVAQRRRRVFLVGHLGGPVTSAVAVLFDAPGLRWDPPPSREAGQDVAGTLAASTGGADENDAANGRLIVSVPSVAQCLTTGTGKRYDPETETLIAINARQDPVVRIGHTDPLGAKDTGHAILTPAGVRRLTPTECERLQGMPDGYTLVPYRGKLAADGPRYKAIGNSMAVPVMAWIGRRIEMVDRILHPHGSHMTKETP